MMEIMQTTPGDELTGTMLPMTQSSPPDGGTSLVNWGNWPLILRIAELVIGIVGLVTNGTVVMVMLSRTSLRKSTTNFYIINQSLIDMLVSLVLILTTQIDLILPATYSGAGGHFICIVWHSKMLLWGPMLVSNYNLVVITIERYLSVARPIWHKNHVTRRRVLWSLAIPWLIGMLYEGTIKFASTVVSNGQCIIFHFPSVGVSRAVGFLYVIIQYIVPLTVICFCYGHMIWHLQVRVRPVEGISAGNGGTIPNMAVTIDPMEKAKRNVIKMMFIVALGFILCWTVNEIFFLSYNLGFTVDFGSDLYHTSVLLVFVNCTINPFIYALKYDQYRKALLGLCFKSPKVGEWSGSHSSSRSAESRVETRNI